MKNIFLKIVIIFAFILSFIPAFAADIGISSVVYDNSSSFLAINTYDNDDDNTFSQNPKLYVLPDENKAYFDINSAILKCSVQNLIVNSPGIKEILVSQFSTNPNIVRVVVNYNQGYNPYNMQLRKVNNTLFLRFRNPSMSNYYFQQTYSESAVAELYETTSVHIPVSVTDTSVMGQINSAFNIGQSNENKNYVLSKKDIVLPTKFYLDNLNFKGDDAIITGVGAITLSKPMYLTNPSRVAYDIQNSVVNTAIRNKEMKFNQGDSIKIGQFNRNTARVVITCSNPDRYIPVIYPDMQRLVFVDSKSQNPQNLTTIKATLNSVYDEITDITAHTMKLVFSKPIVYGISRTASSMNLILYNVDKYQDVDSKSAFIFEGIKFATLKNGGVKLTIPTGKDDIFDIHTGSDGKTLRIKVKSSSIQLPERPTEPVIVVEPVVPKKTSNKKYIVIDPGHGGSDCGAIRNNIYEKNITLDVSKRVTALLEKKGYIVTMTRDTDKTVSLQERVDISEEIEPDIFVSIHVNSSNNTAPNGLETHYYKDNSLKLAKNIHASLLNHINANDRGLFKSKFYVINHTTAPAVLVEIGFLSNPTEREQIMSEARKQATAKAIAEGIYEYFK